MAVTGTCVFSSFEPPNPKLFILGQARSSPRIDWKRSVELKPLHLFNHADAPRRLPSVSRYRMWSGGMPVFFERWLYSAA